MYCSKCARILQAGVCTNCGIAPGSWKELVIQSVKQAAGGTAWAIGALGNVRENYRALMEPDQRWIEDAHEPERPEDFWRPGTIDPAANRGESIPLVIETMIRDANRLISTHAERLAEIKAQLLETKGKPQPRR